MFKKRLEVKNEDKLEQGIQGAEVRGNDTDHDSRYAGGAGLRCLLN